MRWTSAAVPSLGWPGGTGRVRESGGDPLEQLDHGERPGGELDRSLDDVGRPDAGIAQDVRGSRAVGEAEDAMIGPAHDPLDDAAHPGLVLGDDDQRSIGRVLGGDERDAMPLRPRHVDRI